MSDLKHSSGSRVTASKYRLAMEILRHKDREIAYLKRTLTQVALLCDHGQVNRIVKYALANSLSETSDEKRPPDQWRVLPEFPD